MTNSPKPGDYIRSTRTGRQYVVEKLIEAQSTVDTEVLACYRLSDYDGMPIGSLVYVALSDAEMLRYRPLTGAN